MTFLIADDHPFMLAGTKTFIEAMNYKVIGTSENGQDAYEKIVELQPRFAILDINMPELDGMEVLERVRLKRLATKIIFLTSHNEMSIYKKASEYGVDGYLLKNFAQEELSQCIDALMEGKTYLSKHIDTALVKDKTYLKDAMLEKLSFVESKVFELVAQQKSTKEIAELLFLSEKSVEGYRSNIIEKLDLPKERNVLLKFASQFGKLS